MRIIEFLGAKIFRFLQEVLPMTVSIGVSYVDSMLHQLIALRFGANRPTYDNARTNQCQILNDILTFEC